MFVNTAGLVAVGDAVRVTGVARERFNQTTLNGSTTITRRDHDPRLRDRHRRLDRRRDAVHEPDIPRALRGHARHLPADDLVIAEYFNYERFGEVVLALPLEGEDRPFSGTAIDEPGPEANARRPRPTCCAASPSTTTTPTRTRRSCATRTARRSRCRTGSVVATGRERDRRPRLRLQPVSDLPDGPGRLRPRSTHRPEAPEPVGGTLRAAAMNTLNFFLTLDTTASDSVPGRAAATRTSIAVAPTRTSRWSSRGSVTSRSRPSPVWTPTSSGSTRSRTRQVSSRSSPTRGVVAGLNASTAPDLRLIDVDRRPATTRPARTRSASVSIYRTDKVVPVGDFAILDSTVDARFIDTKQSAGARPDLRGLSRPGPASRSP